MQIEPMPLPIEGQPIRVGLRFQLITFSVARTIVNTGYRLIYAFLPIIAAGLGVPIEAITQAVVMRSLLGIAAPVLGTAADRLGHKTAMLIGMVLFIGALGLVIIWPTYPAMVASILLVATSKIIFDPAMQAYIGDRVEYAQRGLAIAITEMGWSGAFLIGMPLTGALIAVRGWSAPYVWLAVVSLIVTFLLVRILPAHEKPAVARPSLFSNLRTVLSHPSALGALSVGLLICTSNEVVGIIYAEWLHNTFFLEAAALGITALVIGFAELGGEGLVAALADRIGKRRALIGGLILNATAVSALPLIGKTQTGAMIGLFLMFITFEVAVVTSISLMTEILPQARATLLAANVSAYSGGRALGAFIGPMLFVLGLRANSIAALVLDVAAVLILLAVVRQD